MRERGSWCVCVSEQEIEGELVCECVVRKKT